MTNEILQQQAKKLTAAWAASHNRRFPGSQATSSTNLEKVEREIYRELKAEARDRMRAAEDHSHTLDMFAGEVASQ